MKIGPPVCLEGSCGIARIGELHRLLVQALPRDRVEVDLSGVECVDTAFVQLLGSACVTATRRGRAFRMIGVPDEVAGSFQRAGFAISPETGRIGGI